MKHQDWEEAMPRRRDIVNNIPLTENDCETCIRDIRALRDMDEMFRQMECAGMDCTILRRKRDELLSAFEKIMDTFFPERKMEV